MANILLQFQTTLNQIFTFNIGSSLRITSILPVRQNDLIIDDN